MVDMLPLLSLASTLAQLPTAAPPVTITQETAVNWPVLMVVIVVASIIVESRLRIAALEKKSEEQDRALASTAAKGTANEQRIEVFAVLLGEIKSGVSTLTQDFKDWRNNPGNASSSGK